MKTILCYGDSNTWGHDPATKNRLGADERWTGVLQNKIGDQYKIIEEGLNGRTTVWDDPIEGYKNGFKQIIPCIESHRPLDLITIMLGTNDLKKRFSVSAYDIAKSVGKLVEIAQNSKSGPEGKPPEVLLMAPPPVSKFTVYAEILDAPAEKSKLFRKYFRDKASELGCDFLDTSEHIKCSDIDGVHFEVTQHQILGNVLASKILQIFN